MLLRLGKDRGSMMWSVVGLVDKEERRMKDSISVYLYVRERSGERATVIFLSGRRFIDESGVEQRSGWYTDRQKRSVCRQQIVWYGQTSDWSRLLVSRTWYEHGE